MKVLALALLFFTAISQAGTWSPEQLEKLSAALNKDCGDIWCSGGDFTYTFQATSYHETAKRLSLDILMKRIYGGGSKAKMKKKCIIYNFKDFSQVMSDEKLSQELYTEIDNCTSTLEENIAP